MTQIRNLDMPMSLYQQLRAQWPWHSTYLRLYIQVPAVIGLLLMAVFFYQLQLYGTFFLLFLPIGLLVRILYARIGDKVAVLRHCKSAQNGEVIDSLMIVGHHQSPGVAILRDSVLILIPIVGRRRKLQLADITTVSESRWLAGKYLWGKRVFKLTTQHGKTLEFAVADTTAERWSARLNGDS